MLNSRTSWLIHPPCPSWRVLLVNTAFLSLDGHCHVLKGTLLDGSPPTQQWSPGEAQAHRRMLLNQGCDVFSWSMLDQGHIPLGSTGPWIFWAKRGKSTYTQSYWLGQARMGEISLVFVCKPTKWGTTECSRWDATPKIDRRKHVGELISSDSSCTITTFWSPGPRLRMELCHLQLWADTCRHGRRKPAAIPPKWKDSAI